MSSIIMYGIPPDDAIRPVSPWIPPQPQTIPHTGPLKLDPSVLGRVADPEDAEGLTKRVDARIAWLENELRMHEAWKAELVILKRMRGDSSEPTKIVKRRRRKKKGTAEGGGEP